MKKTLILTLLLGLAAVASAQMLEDGTANVVNYWKIGDKVTYDVRWLDYKVAKGDTTIVKDTSSRFTVEHTDTLANGDLHFELLEIDSESKVSDEISDKIAELAPELNRFSFRLLTDRLGTFKKIENIDVINEILNKTGLRDSISAALKSRLNGISPDSIGLDCDSLVNLAINTAFSKENVRKTLEPIIGLFAFNGLNVPIGQSFEGTDKRATIFDPNTTVDVKTSISYDIPADENLSNILIVRYDATYDSDQLTEIALKFYERVFDKETMARIRKMNRNPEDPFAYVYENGYLVIDTDTGTAIMYENNLTTYANDSLTVKSFYVELMTDEELEEEKSVSAPEQSL